MGRVQQGGAAQRRGRTGTARLVEELKIALIARAKAVIGHGVIGVVVQQLDVAAEIAGSADHVEIADMAVDGGLRLVPLVVLAGIGIIMHLQIAHPGIEAEIAQRNLLLRGDLRVDRPAFDRFPQQRQAAADFIAAVVVVLRLAGVVQRETGQRVLIAQVQDGRAAVGKLAIVGHVVDVTAFLAVIAHGADRQRFGDGDIDETLGLAAEIAAAKLVGFQVHAAGKFAKLGLVGDHADGAGQRAGAEQRALRARQRLDAFHVIHVHIGQAVHVDRDIVEIIASGRVSAAGRHDAAEIDFGAARPKAGERDGRDQRGKIGQALHAALLQRIGAERLHGDRHLLDAGGRAGGRDDDFLEALFLFGGRSGLIIGGKRRAGKAGQHGGDAQQPDEPCAAVALLKRLRTRHETIPP